VIVTLPGGEQLEAKIVGKDYSTGLGLLKIDAHEMPCVEVVSSESCVPERKRSPSRAWAATSDAPIAASSLTWVRRCGLGIRARQVRVRHRATLSIGLSGGPICNTKAQVVAVSYLNFADLSRAILGVPGENFLAVATS